MRSRSPSLIFTCTLTVSPEFNCGIWSFTLASTAFKRSVIFRSSFLLYDMVPNATADYNMHFMGSQGYVLGVFPYGQHRVVSAKPKGITDRQRNLLLARLVRDVVQVAFRVGRFIVDRWRQNTFRYCFHTKYHFKCACRPHHMSSHRFCG